MSAFLAASGSYLPWIFFAGLGGIALLVWGSQKYKEHQAEKRSGELRQLYADVHQPRRKAS